MDKDKQHPYQPTWKQPQPPPEPKPEPEPEPKPKPSGPKPEPLNYHPKPGEPVETAENRRLRESQQKGE